MASARRISGSASESRLVAFTFFAERYERRSVLVSSNLVFSQWDKIFQDPMTARVNGPRATKRNEP